MSRSVVLTSVRRLRCLLAAKDRQDESDEQLLHAFTSRRDEAAFAVLVRRYGPLVLHVCRRVLGHEQDAEDAFQAVFLVLAQRAASLRNQTSLASFLHGIAYRTAMKAKQSAARRRKHEGQTPTRSPADPADELSWREVRELLDKEIAGLPEIYRSVFVLCVLESASREEAAQRLRLKPGTVASRLAEARKRLSQRLARRGVELTAVLAATTLAIQQASALPAGLMAKTIQAALAAAASEKLAGIVSASVAELVRSMTAAMVVSKAKIATVVLLTVGLLTVATSGSLVFLFGRASGPLAATAEPPPSKMNDKPATAPLQHAATEELEIQGRVLDPDGKPKVGAKLYLRSHYDKPTALGVSAADGRFRFTVPKSKANKWFTVMTTASGYGPDWVEFVPGDKKDELILQIVKDDVPITGQVIDLEGKPVRGATVQILEIRAAVKGDLTPWIEAAKAKKDGCYRLESDYLPRRIPSEDLPGLPTKVTTDAAGRFRLSGIGRERLVAVLIEGPTIVTGQARILTRHEQRLDVVEWKPSDPLDKITFMPYYGADFQHAAAPTKPIVGVVRDKDAKKPLAGVTIQSDQLANNPIGGRDYIRTITNAEGRYRLTGMPKGKGNKIMAVPGEDQPYPVAGAEVPDSFGFGPVTVDFELKRGVWVEGRITDKSTGKGVLWATVWYYAMSDNPHLREYPGFEEAFLGNLRRSAQEHGSFRVLALPGPGVLAVQCSDHYLLANARDDAEGTKEDFLDTRPHAVGAISYNAFARIDPPKGVDSVKRDIVLDPGWNFPVTVVGPDSEPLVGVRSRGLTAWGFFERRPAKSAKLTVRAFNPRRPRPVLFLHSEKRLVGALEPPKDKPAPVTLRLIPGATVTGRLVDKDGQPRGNAELGLHYEQKNGSITHYFPERITTDAAGRFRIDTLLPGYNFELRDVRGYFIFGGLRSGETKDLGDVQTRTSGE